MIEYSLMRSANNKAAAEPIWIRTLLQPLAPGPLTPFSASVLAEITNGSWYNYFDRLGFAPAPKSKIVRSIAGRPYVNLTRCAELDAQFAGIAPPSLCLDGTLRPFCAWEKPGLLAGLKTARGAKKIADLLQTLPAEIERTTATAQTWLQKVEQMRWSQAEILQIMEEIERVGRATYVPFFAARYNLETAYRRLQQLVERPAFPQSAALVNFALAGVEGLVELDIARRIEELAQLARSEPAVLACLPTLEVGQPLPEGRFAAAFAAMLAAYGHRCAGEGELRTPRWSEDPGLLFQSIRALVNAGPRPGTATNGSAALQPLLEATPDKHKKEVRQLVEQIRQLLVLQSQALNAYAFVLAGTRRWALAAAHEALSDQRLLDGDDVYFFELEEVKQMMTGEWNISDQGAIHTTALKRKAEWAGWDQLWPGEILIGDSEATPVRSLPGAKGQARGSAALTLPLSPADAQKAALCALQPDCGWAASLPLASALAIAQGSVLDPIVGAAATLALPVVYELGSRYAAITAHTTLLVDGDAGEVRNG